MYMWAAGSGLLGSSKMNHKIQVSLSIINLKVYFRVFRSTCLSRKLTKKELKRAAVVEKRSNSRICSKKHRGRGSIFSWRSGDPPHFLTPFPSPVLNPLLKTTVTSVMCFTIEVCRTNRETKSVCQQIKEMFFQT